MEMIQEPRSITQSKGLEQNDEQHENLSEALHREKSRQGLTLIRYRDFWLEEHLFQTLKSLHKHFHSYETDIFVITSPKSGTTWLKALTFSIVNRNNYSVPESPLLFSNPHQLVPFLEYIYQPGWNQNHWIWDDKPLTRIFSTHLAYQCLPDTILRSTCRIIYLGRNLLDIIVSGMQFAKQNGRFDSVDEYLERVLSGRHSYGPLCENMLGYWDASLKDPQKILFLKYEDLRKDTSASIKKIAEFLDCPFSAKEERVGLVEEIKRLCSLENLKNLEANKNGEAQMTLRVKNSSLFRKGEVGDWINHLTPSQAEKVQKLMEEKFSGSGLAFEITNEV